MRAKIAATLITIGVMLPAVVSADISVRFQEGAPRDAFLIKNTSACPLGAATLQIDLMPSAGDLIFDTTDGGAGVEVFQPVEIAEASADVTKSNVTDGDQEMTLAFSALPVGPVARITVDLDDQLANSALGQIRVAGSEIAGAELILTPSDMSPLTARFDADNQAVFKVEGCLS